MSNTEAAVPRASLNLDELRKSAGKSCAGDPAGPAFLSSALACFGFDIVSRQQQANNMGERGYQPPVLSPHKETQHHAQPLFTRPRTHGRWLALTVPRGSRQPSPTRLKSLAPHDFGLGGAPSCSPDGLQASRGRLTEGSALDSTPRLDHTGIDLAPPQRHLNRPGANTSTRRFLPSRNSLSARRQTITLLPTGWGQPSGLVPTTRRSPSIGA